MQYLKISIGIFVALAASRFIPHPPNFTSLIALAFYIPAILGVKFMPIIVISFFITDLFLGIHQVVFFTWGSVLLIGLISKFFLKNTTSRLFGSIASVFVFFIITNFGVWLSGMYEVSFNGLILCYTMAIPFLGNSLISTLLFSMIIEFIYNQFTIFIKKY